MTRTKQKNYVAAAARYAEDVVSGKVPACEWAVKACRRQLDDLGKAKSREFPYKVRQGKGVAHMPVHRVHPTFPQFNVCNPCEIRTLLPGLRCIGKLQRVHGKTPLFLQI
jgi:hypothetical protein